MTLHIAGFKHFLLVGFKVIPLAEMLALDGRGLVDTLVHFLLGSFELRALLEQPVAREH